MFEIHVNFGTIFIGIIVGSQCDDVTSLQVENPANAHTTMVLYMIYWRLNHGNDFGY